VQELFPVRLSKTLTLNDNLTVPLVTGLVMQWLYGAL
jgi:dolichol kinase